MRTFGPNQGLLEGRVLSTGTVKGLTILVTFQDVSSTVTRADVEDLLNGDNYTRNGNICSAREYFQRVSSGKLDYTNVVVGPYKLSRNRQFYVNNLLVEEALELAVADGLDLTQFDSRDENIVDALNVLYAGQTQYNGDLWPHNHHITLNFGAMRTDLYLLTSLGRTAADLSIGTFCHENGHLLCRFPDMYDYGQRDGDTTASAGHRQLLPDGVGEPPRLRPEPLARVQLPARPGRAGATPRSTWRRAAHYEAAHGAYDTVLKYRTSKPNEYFLVENRSKMDLDRGAVGSGLAVYHCDILGSNELQQGTATRHYQCALLQADGRRDLELDENQGDGSDLFGLIGGIALSSTLDAALPRVGRARLGPDHLQHHRPRPDHHLLRRTGHAGSHPLGRGRPDDDHPRQRALRGSPAPSRSTGPGRSRRIKVGVDIEHTWIGDLRVTLTSPGGRTAVLHARLGGSRDDLVATYDSASPGVLGDMIGQPAQGDWVLGVVDLARRDEGTLKRWTIELKTAATG